MPAKPSRSPEFVDVALDVRTAGSDAVYTYRAHSTLEIGDAVFVPLGHRSALGTVLSLKDEASAEFQIRDTQSVVPELRIPESTIALVKFVSEEFLCPISVSLSAATPPGALDRVNTVWKWQRDPSDSDALTGLQREVLETVKSQGNELVITGKRKLDSATSKALSHLASKGILERGLQLGQPVAKKSQGILYQLTGDDDMVNQFLQAHRTKRPAQALTIFRFQESPGMSLAVADIKALCGVAESSVKQLIEAGILVPREAAGKGANRVPQLNNDQQLAVDAIEAAISERSPERFLLFGVTGSGKTEVYLRSAAHALKAGRQVLFLVPEIALATQAVGLLRERFGERVAILHSELTPNERLENWLAVRGGKAAIVLGARSALFAPLSNIGLIVVDEEHEQSYKQESAPRYHAKRLAEFLSRHHQCPLVLGSATPSVESFFEAEEEKLTLLTLPKRAANAQLPKVEVVDLAEGYRQGHPRLFTEELASKLQTTFEKKEQSILFLNRRAYAPFIVCRDCGQQFMCPNCAVTLAFSRKSSRLRCHHCGHSERPPDNCPACNGSRIQPFGVGTEKVEESVAELLPGAKVARLDRDITQKKGALEQVLAAFGSGDVDVLVGTQMIAKGLNFPNVTLVGVIAADLSLNFPDFRATERTFQLLSQVAGRAGRGERPGEVVIQTFQPTHPSILAAKEHSYVGFYELLRDERAQSLYPPYCRLVNIVFSGPVQEKVWKAMQDAAAAVREHIPAPNLVLGPVECALERLNNLWRFHMLLKVDRSLSLEGVQSALAPFRTNDVSVLIDVDPYSMM